MSIVQLYPFSIDNAWASMTKKLATHMVLRQDDAPPNKLHAIDNCILRSKQDSIKRH